jgi:hypothetical protein
VDVFRYADDVIVAGLVWQFFARNAVAAISTPGPTGDRAKRL